MVAPGEARCNQYFVPWQLPKKAKRSAPEPTGNRPLNSTLKFVESPFRLDPTRGSILKSAQNETPAAIIWLEGTVEDYCRYRIPCWIKIGIRKMLRVK